MIDKWFFSAIEIVSCGLFYFHDVAISYLLYELINLVKCPPLKKLTSPVYKYYKIVQDGQKYNICGISQKTKCTSNLVSHLQA